MLYVKSIVGVTYASFAEMVCMSTKSPSFLATCFVGGLGKYLAAVGHQIMVSFISFLTLIDHTTWGIKMKL